MSFNCEDCETSIPGTNCAYALSRKMGWRKKPHCYAHCTCGYPVRAKDLRDHVFGEPLDNNRAAFEDAYIYCETKRGQRHVYYGTYDICKIGNGISASAMSSCAVFKRYKSAN
eukprot:RCo010422